MRLTHSLLAVWWTTLAGCYSYQAIDLEEVRADMQVRARVTPAQAEELAPVLPGEDRLIEGTVIDNGSYELQLLVPVTSATHRGRTETLSQRLSIPYAGIAEVELRELDRWKTGVVGTVGALVVGFVLYETLSKGSSGETPGGGGPGPEDARIPVRMPVIR